MLRRFLRQPCSRGPSSLSFLTSTLRHNSSSAAEHNVAASADEFDVAIIGGGIIGCSSALALARKGYKVAVIESHSGVGEGTTSYSSGILRVFYSTLEMSAIALESYKTWQNWRDFLRLPQEYECARFRVCGCAFALRENPDKDDLSNAFFSKVAPNYDALGVPYELWDKETMLRRYAQMGCDNMDKVYKPRDFNDDDFDVPLEGKSYKGAVFFPETAYVADPRQAVKDVHMACLQESNPPLFFMNSKVEGLLYNEDATGVAGVRLRRNVKGKDSKATIPDTDVKARMVINCSGPWSKQVTNMAFSGASVKNDNKITTRALRTDVAVLDAPPGANIDKDGFVIMDLDTGLYVRPEVGNRIMVGGVESPCDPFEWIEDPEANHHESPGHIYQLSVYRAALRMSNLSIPTAGSKSGRAVVSSYDVTEDWNPIIDRSALKGYYQAIGTSGNCFKTAPVLGELLSQLISKEDKGEIPLQGPGSHDEKAITCTLPTIKHDINLAPFSRLRDVGKGGFNVLA